MSYHNIMIIILLKKNKVENKINWKARMNYYHYYAFFIYNV